MTAWPFGVRGGLTVMPFTSDDPAVCAHQTVRLKMLLDQFEGCYEETCMVLNRLEIVYFSAGRREDADRVHADKIALVEPSWDNGDGLIGRLRSAWQLRRSVARFRHGQRVVDHHLADLQRLAPWKPGQRAGTPEGAS